MVLVAERKLADFISPPTPGGVLEASGGIAKEADYYVICEGNRCRAGRAGRKPGGGRLHVLQCSRKLWKPVARIKLPRTAAFEDYSAVSLRGRRLAVLSQQSSRLWIGTLRFGDWAIAD